MGPTPIPRPRKGHVTLRPARTGDGPALAAVFHDAVQRGAACHYSDTERAAWASGAPSDRWEPRLLAGHTTVACHRRSPIGFATLGPDGHLDLFYVSPDWMGKGVAQLLHADVLATARAAGMPLLTTEASHLARSFLTRQGWTTCARQSVIRHGIALTNFRMELPLP